MTFRVRRSTVAALAAVLALGVSLAGCGGDERSGDAFRLPDGDAAAGKQAFVDLRCYVCHPVRGVDAVFEGTPAATVPLGGRVSRVKSYGELVTSIINPSHRIVLRASQAPPPPDAPSAMKFARLNDHLTVQQLIDLVAFLQGIYEVVPPRYDSYVYVYP
jgi:hypothetical protein